MNDPTSRQTSVTLERMLSRLREKFRETIEKDPQSWIDFEKRLLSHFSDLFRQYYRLYMAEYDFYFHLEDLLMIMVRNWFKRAPDLRVLDVNREIEPSWYQSNHVVGGVIYVDLFAGNLEGVIDSIPYFKELQLNYLHLMPLFRVPECENDGGYAVSSYREVQSRLGTMEQLKVLSRTLRQNGISLVLDFIFNHTSDEHEWALGALRGDPDLQDYYRIFPDRRMPDTYERSLREIFPNEHPGAFTYRSEIDMWVWTSFHSYQWDLNYANPTVFNRMAEEMLFLANLGVEVLRLDAVAFIWKQLGTSCENLPQAHWLIQTFNSIARIAAPALLFKSEAIVHPDEVIKYISTDECQLSYNPLLMALLWESLATRNVSLLNQSLAERFRITDGCAWVNYVRCHDDIGWTFSDDDAHRLGINGFDHRKFLNSFYIGRFPGSFACGLPFQENPRSGDARISGTCASLAGLEKALHDGTPDEVELALKRILLLYAIIMTIGGLPLIYLGDELGLLNDYSYREDPMKAHDSRWAHRPRFEWKKNQEKQDEGTVENRLYNRLGKLIRLRIANPVFAGQDMQVINTENQHVLGYIRTHRNQRALVFANFSENHQILSANLLRIHGLGYLFVDLIENNPVEAMQVDLPAYGFRVYLAI